MTRVPFLQPTWRMVGTIVLPAFCVLAACTAVSRPPSSVPPSDEALHVDPARDAQLRLLHEAYRAFVQERYATAVLFFRRFIERASDSPRRAEAHWWLGRALEASGDMSGAMAEYRAAASGRPAGQWNGALYEAQALQRLDELRRHPATQSAPTLERALYIGLDDLSAVDDRGSWLQELKAAGATSVILELSPSVMSGNRVAVEALQRRAAEIHGAGLAVWMSVNLHTGGGVPLQAEWMAKQIGEHHGEAARPDIAHPEYQALMEDRIWSLARAGADGLFLAARSAPGFAQDASPQSADIFTSSFGLPLTMSDLASRPSVQPEQGEIPYWRWVGWRARQYAAFAQRLRTKLREVNPAAGLLVEVHEAAVEAPLQALEQYGEDLAELAQRAGASIAVRSTGPQGEALFEKLGQQLGAMERVWGEIPVEVGTGRSPAAQLGPAFGRTIASSRRHVVVMPRSTAVLP